MKTGTKVRRQRRSQLAREQRIDRFGRSPRLQRMMGFAERTGYLFVDLFMPAGEHNTGDIVEIYNEDGNRVRFRFLSIGGSRKAVEAFVGEKKHYMILANTSIGIGATATFKSVGGSETQALVVKKVFVNGVQFM